MARTLKRFLANLPKRNISQLAALVKTRLNRTQPRPRLLDGFLASTGLELAPFRNARHGELKAGTVAVRRFWRMAAARCRCAQLALCNLRAA